MQQALELITKHLDLEPYIQLVTVAVIPYAFTILSNMEVTSY